MSNFAEQMQARAAVDNAPTSEQEESKRPFERVNLSSCRGDVFLTHIPPTFDWTTKDSLRRACLAALCGAGGCGKGTFALQFSVSLASGQICLETWRPTEAMRCVYISAEDDNLILHRRLHHALKLLPEHLQHDAAKNIHAIAVHGDVSIYSEGATTKNFQDLKKIMAELKPQFVVLDTVARFFGIAENDNPSMTQALGYLEELCQEYQCNFLLIHHTSKNNGALAQDKTSLYAGLEQTAARGFSALTSSVRWQMNMMSLSRGLAAKLIGDEAGHRADGSFVAVRVCKKNAGAPENIVYAQRGEHGLLHYVEPSKETKEAQSVEDDAAALIAAIYRRAEESKPPLSKSRAGQDALGWGAARNQKAVFVALESGKISTKKKEKGNGEILVPCEEEHV